MPQLLRRARLPLAVALLLTTLAAACGDRSSPVTDRFDATLTLLPDGSLDVREVWTVTFGTRPTTTFERVMRSDRADELFDVRAAIDGRPVSESVSRDGISATIADGRRLRVRWTFPPAPGATRRFELGYRAMNVVELQGARGVVRWQALGPKRRMPIAAGRIELTVPPGVVFYGPPGIAEEGWTVSWRTSGIEAERADISRDARATLQADVSVDTLALSQPVWQERDARARQFMPAFVSGGLFFLVIGAGVLWIVRFQHPTRHMRTADAAPAEDELEPALALAAARRTVSVPTEFAYATLVDLVRHGRVSIQSGASEGLVITSDSMPLSHLTHEQIILDQLWLFRGKANVTPGEVARGIEQHRRRFQRAVIDDMIEAGLADRDRVAVASGLRLGGQVTMVFGAVCGAIVGMGLEQFGPWAFVIPGCIFVVGFALVVAGEQFSILTESGEEQSAPWRTRLRTLRQDRVREGETAPIEVFGRWLPLAAGSGFAVPWIKAFGARLPDTERPMIALLHAVSSRGRARTS